MGRVTFARERSREHPTYRLTAATAVWPEMRRRYAAALLLTHSK